MNDTNTQAVQETKCPQCGNPIEASVSRTIIDRGWNPIMRKQFVRQRDMKFCSAQCGSHYQMGCEG